MWFLSILYTSSTVIGTVFKKSLALRPFMANGNHWSNSDKKYEKTFFTPYLEPPGLSLRDPLYRSASMNLRGGGLIFGTTQTGKRARFLGLRGIFLRYFDQKREGGTFLHVLKTKNICSKWHRWRFLCFYEAMKSCIVISNLGSSYINKPLRGL